MNALQTHESLPMFAVSDELAPRIRALGLERNLREMEDLGYTVIEDAVTPEFINRLRNAILTACDKDKGQYFNITEHGASADMLLIRDSVFAEAVMDEKLLAMMEYMCGRNPIISQLSGSVRHQGAKAMPLHADQDWLPAPLPEHNALMTGCFYCDDMVLESGPTKVVPGTHKLRRQPTPKETVEERNAVPLLGRKGSIGLWDGRLWHSNYARTQAGSRVVLHATYTRLAYRPLEDYGTHGKELAQTYGPVMASLLGHNLWFGNRSINNGAVDMSKYETTWLAARR
jgi:ectoine hydroxylase-related dioxygenase (phytanoyl-CoA dioxygenase family)